jgi:hypothetical protein
MDLGLQEKCVHDQSYDVFPRVRKLWTAPSSPSLPTTVDDCRVALRHLAVSLRMSAVSAIVALSAFLYERNILISPCGM